MRTDEERAQAHHTDVAEGRAAAPVTVRDWCKYIHSWAKGKGWWDKPRDQAEMMLLATSEIVEAYEEWRDGHEPNEIWYSIDKQEMEKPEGVGIEMADAVIRIMDWCEAHNVDLQSMIAVKMAYNEKRPYRHGGKRS